MPFRMLGGLRMVLPTPGTGRRTELEAMFGRLGVRPVPVVEADERLAWVTSVTDGLGSLIWYRDMVLRAFGHRVEVRSFTPPLLRAVGIVAPTPPAQPPRPRLPLARPAQRTRTRTRQMRWTSARRGRRNWHCFSVEC